MLTKSQQSQPGEYLRFVWKVYRPLFCSKAAIQKSLEDALWGNGTFVVVDVSGGYAVPVSLGVDYETWESVVRMNRAAPAPKYQAVLAGLESFNGTFSCSTANDAIQLIESERISSGSPNDSAAKTIADRATEEEAKSKDLSQKVDDALSAVKTSGVAVVFIALAYITAKLTGIIKA